MYHRIMELLVLLMDEYGGGNLPLDQVDSISADLIRRGYTEQEIETALFWLQHRLTRRTGSIPVQSLDVQNPAETSFRLLHPFERRCFSTEAFGYLLHLMSVKLINQRDLEQIIERVLVLDLAPASLDDLKLLTQSLLFEEGGQSGTADRAIGPRSQGETYH